MVNSMTYREAYQKGKELLQKAQDDSCAFEALELWKKAYQKSREDLLLRGNDLAPQDKTEEYLALLSRRQQGYPLQYLLGEWEFYSLPFTVGEGVLIPRADTETLIDVLLTLAQRERPYSMADLCSGSGCIACTVGNLFSHSHVEAVEKSQEAFSFLTKNISRHHLNNVTAVLGDVTEYTAPIPLDFILSNPPYVTQREMASLQTEVTFEPAMALQAGEDGLDFYRLLTRRYPSQLRPGGWMVLEIGKGQEQVVAALMRQGGLRAIGEAKDIQGIVRVVYGQKP